MLKHYFKSSLKNLFRYKSVSIIKMLSLIIGLACSFIILIWIEDQLSVDRKAVNSSQIYRLQEKTSCGMPAFSTDALAHFPAIESFARLEWKRPQLFKYEQHRHLLEDMVFADPDIFDLFSYEWIAGNPDHALPTDFSMVLTEKTALDLFGQVDAVGKILQNADGFDFTVSGVIKEPQKQHLKIQAIANFNALPALQKNPRYFMEDRWSYLIYCRLQRDTEPVDLARQISHQLQKDHSRIIGDSDFILFPYTSVYFAEGFTNERGVRHGNKKLLLVFALIGMATLLIACINFVNLSIAHSSYRAKEIAIRKMNGAGKARLSTQFMFECLLVVVLSIPFVIVLIELILPGFNRITGDSLHIEYGSSRIWISLIAMVGISTLLAGLAPSMYMAGSNSLRLMRNRSGQRFFQQLLLVMQFSLAIMLIMGSITSVRQSSYLHQANPGFNPQNVIHLNTLSDYNPSMYHAFKQNVLQYPDIQAVSISQNSPGSIGNVNTWKVRGEDKPMEVILADPSFIPLLDIDIQEGRNFSESKRADKHRKIIINEKAIDYLGFTRPIGAEVIANGRKSEIIGVVSDFHYNSLHHAIEPMAICWEEQWSKNISIKLDGKNIPASLERIHKAWERYYPDITFSYAFLEDSFAEDYQSEKKILQLLLYFTLNILFLAGIGLFGLSLFIIQKRTREIAVRKVLGASAWSVMGFFARLFSGILTWSFLIAWPLGFLLLRKWLQSYIYKTDVGIGVFLLSGIFASLIAISSLGLHIYRAGRINVVKALKHE